ncbi:PKD domain-containing protein [Mucilaginibacter ginsenosidivorax]|uniref:PKD domain-containing protein n=1 Tax=Mucilaginibacter ginsenosidivorax TaxID=862126 RepID=A0A5B8WC14_9SPHI|nr:PKD domain-containing protein [Mucilaginibacter ginsenosidivorax]QEC79588.1 PKD domain-containing protein [Mucilaginibacter ginsenosidivorax]
MKTICKAYLCDCLCLAVLNSLKSQISYLISVVLFFVFFNSGAKAQNGFSNQGTEFWTVYMDHIDPPTTSDPNGTVSKMDLYITADADTKVTVAIADGTFSQSYDVVARQILTVVIPPSAFIDKQGLSLKGIHITAQKPVAVYAHIFAQSVSGATLLLPVNVLGKDYLSINYTQQSNSLSSEKRPSYSTFAVIGTEDNTTVEITPITYLLNGEPPGKPFTVILNKGQVYQGLANNDLTGTRIRTISTQAGTCKKVAVFSGSSKILIGCITKNNTSDNLFQQVYPTGAWGKNYITAPLKSRYYDVFRIVKSDPNTTVNLNGTNLSPSDFVNGLYYEFNSTRPNVIKADKPVQVVQYAVTQFKTINCIDTALDIGDPEMIYLNPLEQTLDHVTLNSTGNFRIANNYINVIIKTAAVPTFALDGKPYTEFTPVSNSPDYSYAQIYVYNGVHHISASDGFNAIAYGFGNAESYGYAAGTNLKNLTRFIALDDPKTNITSLNGCSGVSYKIQLTLPYKTTHIKWDFKNGITYNDSNPVVKSTSVKGGQTLYLYEYAADEVYKAGDYTILATVFNPVADECGSDEDVELDFNISDPPVSKLNFSGVCLGDTTFFRDTSVTNGREIKTWLWDFGDGHTDVVQNPWHVYTKAGNYTVRLTIANENGCADISDAATVSISNLPVANFEAAASGCPAQDITFTDQSVAGDGAISKWIWDFGDSTAVVIKTDKSPFTHVYPVGGTYNIKLTVLNANGCAGPVKQKTIVITPLPVVDFILPDACVADNVQFKDSSIIADHTENEFIYHWNFGDINATAANNISAEKNPLHHYTQARDDYQVTLTVTSKYGCSYTKTKTFVVNGDIPKANVVLKDPSAVCSNKEVFFENRSTVNFGNITRLEVTFDVADASSLRVYEHPAYGQQLRYTYPIFTDGDRTFNVHVAAYSGGVCANIQEFPVVVKATHVITLTQVPSICPEATPVQLAPLSIIGQQGSGAYSGKGVSGAGLFSPAVAGTGTAEVSYIYTTPNSCPDTVKQQIMVYPSPTVSSAGPLTVLEGATITLNTSATGHNLSYKWYPAVGLDHDDVLNPVASPTENTSYRLTVTSAEGCSSSADVMVKVLKYLVIPNAFTPNGDGRNDVWDVKYLDEYPNNTVEVYNRYGEKVFSSIGYPVPWDGRYKGNYLSPGTYYYIINPKNGRKVVSGSVTIMR